MSNMDNDAYLLFLKQEQILKQSQAANNNKLLQQENQRVMNELNAQNAQSGGSSGSGIGENHLEKVLDFMAKQNQLDMNVRLNKTTDEE